MELDVIMKLEELIDDIAQDNEVINSFRHHSVRVMFFAGKLARIVGCYDDDLRIAALLHDIGKMGITKEILFKPGRLNDVEYMIIQSHCHIGNIIIRKKLNRPRAATYVRDHHERWDGKGYPRGLKEAEISIQGRIISICDAFDTMTIERRTYKKETLSYEQAIEELRKCSWTQFDGDLVEHFINVISKMDLPEASLPWYSDRKSIEFFMK